MRTPACFEDKDTRKIIEELCRRHNVDLQLIEELSDAVQKQSGLRKDGMASDISACIESFLARSQPSKKK